MENGLLDAEFQFGVMKSCGDGLLVFLDNLNVVNGAELYT